MTSLRSPTPFAASLVDSLARPCLRAADRGLACDHPRAPLPASSRARPYLLAAERGNQILDLARLFLGGRFLRLDVFDDVLTQSDAVCRLFGGKLGAAARDI